MTRAKFTRKRNRAGLTFGHLRQLLTGVSVARFFPGVDDFGTDADAMGEAWCDRKVREAVAALQRDKYPGRPPTPFAELAFGPDGKARKVDLSAAAKKYHALLLEAQESARPPCFGRWFTIPPSCGASNRYCSSVRGPPNRLSI